MHCLIQPHQSRYNIKLGKLQIVSRVNFLLFIYPGEINLKTKAQSFALIDPELFKLKSIAFALLTVSLIFLSLVFLAEGRCEMDSAALKEVQTTQRFEALRENPEELRAFFLAMPKGGDIHNHLTGSIYAEYLIDQASAQNLCIDLDNYTVSAKYCGSTNSEPVKNAYSDSKLYGRIVDAWSMRDSELLEESKRDISSTASESSEVRQAIPVRYWQISAPALSVRMCPILRS